jgi:hypothetical protein
MDPQANQGSRWSPRRIVAEHVVPKPPPERTQDRVVYGLMQPLVGARLLVTDGELRASALAAAALLFAACAVVALLRPASSVGGVLYSFYAAFALLAPVPSVLLAHRYARMAVLARHKLGFSPAEPCLEPLRAMLVRAVKQTILVALAIAPAVGLLRLVPIAGPWLVKIVAAGWALHWIVVDAFDSARFLRPGQTLADLEAHADHIRPPWYVRGLQRAAARVPIGGRLLARFARLCDRLSRPWREEIALVEDHPALMLGFALSTAALLAIPVVNLLFRPIVIIGATHVLGRLEAIEPGSPALPPPTA